MPDMLWYQDQIVADINNDGVADAIVGTEDGYLLAVNTADGSLTWSLPMYAPAGEAMLSDIDGVELLEIVVSTKNGYLYVVDQTLLPGPPNVRDIPMALPIALGLNLESETAADVDTTSVRTAFLAAWDAVDGADGYLVSARTTVSIVRKLLQRLRNSWDDASFQLRQNQKGRPFMGIREWAKGLLNSRRGNFAPWFRTLTKWVLPLPVVEIRA